MNNFNKFLWIIFLSFSISASGQQQIIFENFENGDPFTAANINTGYEESDNDDCEHPSYRIGDNLQAVCDAFPDVDAIDPAPGNCMSMNEDNSNPPDRLVYSEQGLTLNAAPHVLRYRNVQRHGNLNHPAFTEPINMLAVILTSSGFAVADVDLPLNTTEWMSQTMIINPSSSGSVFAMGVSNPQLNGDFAIDDIDLCGTTIEIDHIGPKRWCMDGEINICGTVEACGLLDKVELIIGRDNQAWLTLEVDVDSNGNFCYSSPNADELFSLGLEPGLYYDVVPVLTLDDANHTTLVGESYLSGTNDDFRLHGQTEASVIFNKSANDKVTNLGTFCFGDPIFFHGTADQSDRFHVGVRSRPIGSNGPFENWQGQQENFSFDGASYDLTEHFNFPVGFEYQVTFGVSDVPNCIGWTPVIGTFEVIDCCAIEPFGYTAFPECTYEGHQFKIDVLFNESLTEEDIDLIYSTSDNFKLIGTNIEISQPSGITTISLTFESLGCSCDGDMVSFDIRLEGCTNNIWIMSDNIPCCESDCSEINLDFANITDDCSIVNGEISYPFEGQLSALSGSEIISISANGTGGLCPTNIAVFDYQIVNEEVQFSGIVQALNPDCEWGDLELTIETDKACCTLVIPFSYPKPCDDVACLESAPAIEGIFEGIGGNEVVISVPNSSGTVIIKDNLTGQTSTQSIGKVECGPYALDKWGNWTGVDCEGFSYRVDYDCRDEDGEETGSSLYDFTIIVGECEYRFVGDYCDEPTYSTPKQDDDVIGGRSFDDSKGAEFDVRIYPNPSIAGTNIYVESSAPMKQINIYDMNGQLLTSQDIASDQPQKQAVLSKVSNLTNGLYLVKIVSVTDSIEYKKLVIQND